MSQNLYENIMQHMPTAKNLLLSMFNSRVVTRGVRVGRMTAWGEIFGHEDGAIRIAANRMVKQGLLSQPARGIYEVGPSSRVLSRTAQNWRHTEQRLGDWSEGWLCLHSGHLPRADKTQVKVRDRVFRLNGFRQLVPGLSIRPDNFKETSEETFNRLVELGLEAEVTLSASTALFGRFDSQPIDLWPREELENSYRDLIELMNDSSRRLVKIARHDAARECILVGEYVIKQILADPLLPDEMIDGALRRAVIDRMKSYQDQGDAIWYELFPPKK